MATYHAYAAALLTEHGLRIGHEPDTRVITDAARYQLGARVVDRYDGPVGPLTDHAETAIQNLLALDAAMSEHLVDPERGAGLRRRAAGRLRARRGRGAGRQGAQDLPRAGARGRSARSTGDASCSGWSTPTAALKADLGLMDFSDQIELGARLARPARGRGRRAGEVPRRAARRVPGHLGRPGDDALPALLRARRGVGSRPRGDRRRRPQPGDLRLAGRVGRPTSSSSPTTFPAVGGAVPTYPLTVNRRSDRRILQAANRLAAPLYARSDAIAPLEPKPGAADGAVTRRRPRDPPRRAGGPGRGGAGGARGGRGGARRGRGPTSGCSPATTPTPPRSSTR